MSSTARQLFLSSGCWLFCFMYTLLYLPENWEKRAHWVLPEGVFHPAQNVSLSMRLYLSVVIASSITATVLLGFFLHLWDKNDQKTSKTIPATSLSVLIKEYSLLIITGAILYTSIYVWCISVFNDQSSFGYEVASIFFVDSAADQFAWISAGFYTSVLALSFFQPFEYKKSYCFSNRFALMLAAVGGFGGMAGVGGVVFIITADLIDIASTLLYDVIMTLEFLEYSAFVLVSIFGSYFFFFGLGSTLHILWYIQQRSHPETWKCQPKRWLSFEDHRHEIILGTINITTASFIAGSLGYNVIENGWTLLYFSLNDFGYFYFLLSIPALFLYTEAIAYYVHRTYHSRFLYKNFHKWHHRYKAPTSFGALAMHPIEYLTYQFFLLLPIFVVPIHFMVYGATLMYLYYFGMMDHSGIDFSSLFPWQPPSRYHDDHHKYFHCNFGQNTVWFDEFHQTKRKLDKQYSETIFNPNQGPSITPEDPKTAGLTY